MRRMPTCDSVNDRKAPTAKSGISRSVMPPKPTRPGDFPQISDSNPNRMNLFSCFSDSVDIIWGQAQNRHANGPKGFDINPFSSICDSDRRLLDQPQRRRQFVPAGICWVVERSFAWLSRYRRLNTIVERSKEHLIALVPISLISSLSRRLKRLGVSA